MNDRRPSEPNLRLTGGNEMRSEHSHRLAALLLGAAIIAVTNNAAMTTASADDLSYRQVADMLYRVMSADRAVYANMVVQRLSVDDNVITASEYFRDDAALPLPAQMFRFGAERVAEESDEFSYALVSLDPINRINGPGTDLESEGLEFVAANPDEAFYGEEELGGQRYFAAVYPDIAVADACVVCHNNHDDSPRRDIELGDVMGGVVIRIPMD